MTLIHHSRHVLRGPIRCPAQGQGHNGPGKPHGFWFSVQGEDDWEHWCRGERWGLHGLRYQEQIFLDPAYPILVLDTEEKLIHFDLCFASHPPWVKELPGVKLRSSLMEIDWVAVAWAYAGIIIAPYQWSCRFGLFWYYGWDCASGVVWNEDAIRGYKRIK